MKNFKQILSIFVLLVVATSGLLFGCGNKYKNLKISTDVAPEGITLFLDEDTEDNKPSVAKFDATVSGAEKGVSTKVIASYDHSMISLSAESVSAEKTTYTIGAIERGSTEITLMTEEGGKSTKIKVNIEVRLKEIHVQTNYKPYVLVGGTTTLNKAQALTFVPSNTTWKDVKFSMVGTYAGVEVLENGVVNATEDAAAGKFKVVATSTKDGQISSEQFDVAVIKPIEKQDITLKIADQPIESLTLIGNVAKEAYKVVNVDVATEMQYEILTDSVVTNGTTDIVAVTNNQHDLVFDAINKGSGVAKIKAKIIGYDYSVVVDLPVEVIEIPSKVVATIDGKNYDSGAKFNIFNTYKNQLGMFVRVNVLEDTAKDRRFVLVVDDQDTEKFEVIDADGKPYALATQNAEDYHIFENGNGFYVRVKQDYNLKNGNERVNLHIVAFGTINLEENLVENLLQLDLKNGITAIEIKNTDLTNENVLQVAIGDKSRKILVGFKDGEYTGHIKSMNNSNCAKIDESVVYDQMVANKGSRVAEFSILGLQEGTFTVEFFAENGEATSVDVRVYSKINTYQISCPTIDENSSIGALSYSQDVLVDGTQTNLKSLGSIAISQFGSVVLSINPYLFENGVASSVSGGFKTYNFKAINEDENNRVIAIGNKNGIIAAQRTGKAQIVVSAVAYTDSGEVALADQTIEVTVYVAIDSKIKLDASSIVLYTADSLGYLDKALSTHEFKILGLDSKVKNENGEPLSEKDFDWIVTGLEGEYEQNQNIITAKTVFGSAGSAVVTAIYRQYERTYILKSQISIRKAQKVSEIYNLQLVSNNQSTAIKKVSRYLSDNILLDDEYFVYLDIRNIGQNKSFEIKSTITPFDALNKDLTFIYEGFDKNEKQPVINVANGKLVPSGSAGLAKIYICANDSAIGDDIQNPNNYSTQKVVYFKVADGNSELTSLEIEDAESLASINNNKESLSKFYLITKDINLSSYANWTPIGVIDGEVIEFTGTLNGLQVTKGEYTLSVITGLRFNEENDKTLNYKGLFAKLGKGANIKNINITTQDINLTFNANSTNAETYFGALAGTNNGDLKNVSVTYLNYQSENVTQEAIISQRSYKTYVGGIVGKNEQRGTIENCFVDGKLSVVVSGRKLDGAFDYIGGVVGYNDGTIDGKGKFVNEKDLATYYNCTLELSTLTLLDDGTLSNKVEYGVATGGLVGFNTSELKNIAFDGRVEGATNVGGAVGINTGKLEGVFVTGHISGYNAVGGLAGKLQDGGTINFCAVNMYDENLISYTGEITPNIIANGAVGGLVGVAKYSSLGTLPNVSNSFVKSYFVRSTSNYVADIYADSYKNSTIYAGGLVGEATNLNIAKCYFNGKINANDTSKAGSYIGGLIGNANNASIANCYSRGQVVGSFVSAGNTVGVLSGNSTLSNSYSTINEANSNYLGFVGNENEFKITATASYYISGNTNGNNARTSEDLKTISNFVGWNIKDTIDANSIWSIDGSGRNDGYPALCLDGKSLGIEAPKSLEISAKASAIANKQIIEISSGKYLLWKHTEKKKNSVKFLNLFDLNISPDVAGSEVTILSGDLSILKVTGKTNRQYLLEIRSVGSVTLTVTSKLNNTVSQQIEIIIYDNLENFALLSGGKSVENTTIKSFVGESRQLSIRYSNLNVFKVKIYSQNAKAQYVGINNESMSYNDTLSRYEYVLNSSDKLYISSPISLDVELSYVPYIEYDGIVIELDNAKQFTFTSYYAIKELKASINQSTMTLNNTITIKYTAVGDDLRMNGKLPNFELKFDAYNYVVATFKSVVAYNQNNVISANADGNFDEEITTLEYFYTFNANTQVVKEFFGAENNKNISSVSAVVGATLTITNGTILDGQTKSLDTLTEFTITRLPLQNIGLDFYASAEKNTDKNGEQIYSVNEVPSNNIVAGQIGMLRISLYPVEAEINTVKVYLTSSNGYPISMLQVVKSYYYEQLKVEKESYYLKSSLFQKEGDEFVPATSEYYSLVGGKYEKDANGPYIKVTPQDEKYYVYKVKYFERKPYATSINNSLGLQLYNESNLINREQQKYDFDGSLYVNFLIPSIVAEGTRFEVVVEVNYTNGNVMQNTISLTSDIPSGLEVTSRFENQSFSDVSYVAYGVNGELTLKITKLDVSLSDKNLTGVKTTMLDENGNEINNDKVTLECINLQKSGSVSYATFNINVTDKSIKSIRIYFSVTKTVNNQQVNYVSNILTLHFTDFIVRKIEIDDSGNNNYLAAPTNTTIDLNVNLECVYGEDNKEYIEGNIAKLKYAIESNLNNWFAKKKQSINYEPLVVDTIEQNENYTNYKVDTYVKIYEIKAEDETTKKEEHTQIRIKPMVRSEGEYIYCVVRFDYSKQGENILVNDGTLNVNTNTGFSTTNEGTTQVLRDFIITRFYNDVSSTNPIPVETAEQFLTMSNGSENAGVYYYGLTDDITLENYSPIDISYLHFEGNEHTITIKSFNYTENFDGNLGLFATIDENSTVQSVTVKYDIGDEIDLSQTEISTINFGGVAAENHGVMYDVSVIEGVNGLTFKLPSGSLNTVEAFIGGVAGQNDGYISHCESSLPISASRGYFGGFVGANSNKISASKVILTGNLESTSTTDLLTKTAGFASTNSGTIFGCYVTNNADNSSKAIKNNTKSIKSYASSSGFVYENSGTVSNSFSAITIKCETRSSGFVYNNKGTIQSCYSACYLEENNIAHNPFTAIDDAGNILNTGTIDDCYYQNLVVFGSTAKEIAKRISKLGENESYTKDLFAKFVFTHESDIPQANDAYNGIWKFDEKAMPTLVDADLNIICKQKYGGTKLEGNTYKYIWNYDADDPKYGQEVVKDEKTYINPRTIASFAEFNTILNNNGDAAATNKDNWLILLKDIDCDDYTETNSATFEFGGIMLGNNMSIKNLYLNAKSSNPNEYYGMFGKIEGYVHQNDNTIRRSIVKNLDIEIKQLIANNISYVGALAGRIDDSDVLDIDVNAGNVVIQGKFMVGGIVGLAKNTTLTSMTISASVNASYRGDGSDSDEENQNDLVSNFPENFDEFEKQNKEAKEKGEKGNSFDYSYVGTIAGVITGKSVANNIQVSGDCRSIGYFASAGIGLVDKEAKANLINVTIDPNQYVRAFYIAGGVVAENRGTISNCSIAHAYTIQYIIDCTNSTNNRNFTFFSGGPRIIGGLVGFNNGGTIKSSFSKLDVRSKNRNTYSAGGLVGVEVKGTIDGCYATGSVISYYTVGGLVGTVSAAKYLIKTDEGEKSSAYMFKLNAYIKGKAETENGEDASKTSITNCFASNRWLTNAEPNEFYTDSEILSAFTITKGLFIGCVNYDKSTEMDSEIKEMMKAVFNFGDMFDESIENEKTTYTSKNNYISTQISNEITDKNIEKLFSSNTILQAFAQTTAETITKDNLTTHAIGRFSKLLTGVGGTTNALSAINMAKMDCSNALISYYLLNKKDEFMNEIYGLNTETNKNNYGMILPKDLTFNSIYPDIELNINNIG